MAPKDENDTSHIDDGIYHRIRNAYEGLPWQQKVALKRVLDCGHAAARLNVLIGDLEFLGFRDPKHDIVRALVNATVLTETNYPRMDVDTVLNSANAEISIKNTEVIQVLRKAMREAPLC